MTQPDIYVAVDFALAQTGKPYCLHRPIVENAPCYDCSALYVAGLLHAGVVVPPGVSNTVDIYNWAKRVGGLVSVDTAVKTRGAALIKGKWYGYGPLGHVSYSLGDGTEMAAHGFRSGIHTSTVDVSFYQDGFIIPDVNYHLAPPVDWTKIAELAAWRMRVTAHPLRFGDRGVDVQTLNDLLLRKGLVKKSGDAYGKMTRDGVVHLKKVKNVGNVNGMVFGGEAADALLGVN